MDKRSNEFMAAVQPVLDGLYGAGVRLTGSRADADDLVQESLLHAFQAWDRFEPGTNVRAWLHRILMNTYISGYRRRVRERRALDVETDPSRRDLLLSDAQTQVEALDGGLCPGSIGRGLREAIDALPEEFRSVLLMADLCELSYREIADALGCPMGTVMSRLHRARRAVAAKLGAQHGHPVTVEAPVETHAHAA